MCVVICIFSKDNFFLAHMTQVPQLVVQPIHSDYRLTFNVLSIEFKLAVLGILLTKKTKATKPMRYVCLCYNISQLFSEKF